MNTSENVHVTGIAAWTTAARSALMRAHVAEFVGTFVLVFAGCGAVVIGRISPVGVALTFGLVIGLMVYSFGHISGGHFNPAVSLGVAVGGHLPWLRVATYAIAQSAGAIAGALALRATLGAGPLGVTHPTGSDAQSFVLEVVFTTVLVLVVTVVATDPRAARETGALAIGGAIVLGGLAAGPVSGASLNPARSLGPALVSGDFAGLWIYLAAPLVGAIVAGILYRYLRGGAAAA